MVKEWVWMGLERVSFLAMAFSVVEWSIWSW